MFSNLKIVLIFLLALFGAVLSQEIPDEGNSAVENYFRHVMRNYTAWLAGKDPLPPIPDIITVDGTFSEGNVDVNLEIKNQYMIDHSKTTSDQILVTSYLDLSTLMVARNTLLEIVTFGGEYKINSGVYRASASRTLTFSGTGNWVLKADLTVESLTFGGFTLTQDGYIDVTQANKAWAYRPDWAEINYENLLLDGEGVTEEDHQAVREALAESYSQFLVSREPSRQFVPPYRLLFDYMNESVKKITLSDMISEWKPTTTTTEDASGKDSCSRSEIFGGLLAFVAVLHTYLL